jgi:penicillin-binding protein 1A
MAARSTTAEKKRPWYRRWWMFLLVIPAILVAAVGLLAFYLLFSSVPLPDDIAAQTSMVYDVNGEEVSGLAADATREDRDLGDLPEHVSQAVMGAEDRSFYDHRGISARGIGRALFTNVRAGDIEQGGSTITQQYIKNAEAGTEQTYTRKVREAALAVKLEQVYEKDDILEFYLNTIYWGRGAYGIEAAAGAYFDVGAEDLDVNQAATLAGIIAAPEAMDPLENPDRADQRRRFTLNGMLEQGWIDQAEHDELVESGLPDVTERQRIDMGPNAWYLDAIRRELSSVREIDDNELFRGLQIYTELDPRLQQLAQETLREAMADSPTDGGAIASVHPATGGVRALVGGPDITRDEFNVALRGARQVGSTFKAFTLQAFVEDGNSPESRFSAPAEITIDNDGEPYPVGNFGGQAYGEQSVYQATASSTNTVYMQMQEEAGRERVVDATRRAGLPVTKAEEPYPTDRGEDWSVNPNASVTLGVDSFSPLEMASAFGTWAAEGLHVTPHLITRVESQDGAVIWEPEIDEDEDVELNIARTVTDALRGVVESGTGTSADIGRPSAGKTGTTDNSWDAWYVGYVPQLSTAVWLGNLDNSEIEGGATGGGLAAPVWGEYMRAAVEPWEVEDFVRPDLTDLESLNDEPETCPEGYRFAEPPDSVDEDGFFPDVLTDITDEQGRPCVEEKPVEEEEDDGPEEQCPEGYAFADPPSDDADPMPDVITDITDEQGRPCVEQSPQPEDDGDEADEDDDGDGDDDSDESDDDGDTDGDLDDEVPPGQGDGDGDNGNGAGGADGGDGGDDGGDDDGDGEVSSGGSDTAWRPEDD